MSTRERIAMLSERIGRGHARPGDAAQLATLKRLVNSARDMPGGVTGAEDNRAKLWRRYPKDEED